MKMLIEIDLDGYDTEKEMFEACEEFVLDELNMTASSITILWKEKIQPPSKRQIQEEVRRLQKQLGSMDDLRKELEVNQEYQEAEMLGSGMSLKDGLDWLPGGDQQMRGC